MKGMALGRGAPEFDVAACAVLQRRTAARRQDRKPGACGTGARQKHEGAAAPWRRGPEVVGGVAAHRSGRTGSDRSSPDEERDCRRAAWRQRLPTAAPHATNLQPRPRPGALQPPARAARPCAARQARENSRERSPAAAAARARIRDTVSLGDELLGNRSFGDLAIETSAPTFPRQYGAGSLKGARRSVLDEEPTRRRSEVRLPKARKYAYLRTLEGRRDAASPRGGVFDGYPAVERVTSVNARRRAR